MRTLIGFVLSALALAAAGKPAAIPAGAKKSQDGSYRFTDARGKKWIYRRTPFGTSRAEDRPAVADAAAEKARFAAVKATDAGDRIRFERPGPFGTYRWETPKSRLSPMERAVWDREKASAAAQD